MFLWKKFEQYDSARPFISWALGRVVESGAMAAFRAEPQQVEVYLAHKWGVGLPVQPSTEEIPPATAALALLKCVM